MSSRPTTAAVLAMALILMATGCKKDSGDKPANLTGEWELAEIESPWVGHVDYKPGNGNTIVFSNDTYVQVINYNDTSYQVSGTYSIYRGRPCLELGSDTELTVLQFDDNMPNVFSYSGATFSVSTPPCLMDGGISTYRRKILF